MSEGTTSVGERRGDGFITVVLDREDMVGHCRRRDRESDGDGEDSGDASEHLRRGRNASTKEAESQYGAYDDLSR